MLTTVSEPVADGFEPGWLEIDLEAVVYNFRVACDAAGSGVAVFPVVKADGYGLGAVAIARALAAAGADGFCVAQVAEGAALRKAGIRHPLVLLSGLGKGGERGVVELGLQPFVYDLEQARRLSVQAGETPVPLFLKVDTGMGRLGVAPEMVPAAVAELDRLPGVALAGLVSHLACADQWEQGGEQGRKQGETARQLQIFQRVLNHPAVVRCRGRASLANSAGLLGYPETRFQWVRPGIMLYGASPFFPGDPPASVQLRPVVRWLCRILQVRELPVNTPVGYGHTFKTRRPTRIALLAAGYGSGYSRRLGNRGRVLVAGRRVPVIGRVSMDLMAVDVTGIENPPHAGEIATLLGPDGLDCITLEEMAGWMETIPYELLCRLHPRLPRRYHSRL